MKFVLLLALASLLGVPGASAERPNIVLILADDLGWGDLRTYNPHSRIDTPHLDRIARAGVRFTDAHAGGSVCVPSRHALLTGRFSVRAESLRDRAGPVIPEGRETIADLLRRAGYFTAMVGKWHQGFVVTNAQARLAAFDYSRPLRGGPRDRGFDHFFGMHASLDIPPYFYIRDRQPTRAPQRTIAANSSVGGPENWTRIQGAFWREGPVGADFVHAEVTPRFRDEAVKVIDRHATERAKQPLFLYLALPSPHTPWLPREEFRGRSGAGMYGDFVMQVDAVVGAVEEALRRNKLSRNTLLLFSSDNGPVWYEKDLEKFRHDAVGGLRGRKGTPYEGGQRVPFIATWPDRIPAGSTSAQTICFSDLFATLSELTGTDYDPATTAEDSVSFLPWLTKPDRPRQARPAIIHDQRNVRSGDWKLIVQRSRKRPSKDDELARAELYNLADDPSETRNLIAEHPEKARELQRLLASAVGE